MYTMYIIDEEDVRDVLGYIMYFRLNHETVGESRDAEGIAFSLAYPTEVVEYILTKVHLWSNPFMPIKGKQIIGDRIHFEGNEPEDVVWSQCSELSIHEVIVDWIKINEDYIEYLEEN